MGIKANNKLVPSLLLSFLCVSVKLVFVNSGRFLLYQCSVRHRAMSVLLRAVLSACPDWGLRTPH
jgi:hypothetical protein